MLYKMDFTRRNDGYQGTRLMKNFASETDAYKQFMDDFFRERPGDAVRVDKITCIEFTGDLSQVDEVIAQLERETKEKA